jgi:hypothetical protein
MLPSDSACKLRPVSRCRDRQFIFYAILIKALDGLPEIVREIQIEAGLIARQAFLPARGTRRGIPVPALDLYFLEPAKEAGVACVLQKRCQIHMPPAAGHDR